jgi:hypothetical protein
MTTVQELRDDIDVHTSTPDDIKVESLLPQDVGFQWFASLQPDVAALRAQIIMLSSTAEQEKIKELQKIVNACQTMLVQRNQPFPLNGSLMVLEIFEAPKELVVYALSTKELSEASLDGIFANGSQMTTYRYKLSKERPTFTKTTMYLDRMKSLISAEWERLVKVMPKTWSEDDDAVPDDGGEGGEGEETGDEEAGDASVAGAPRPEVAAAGVTP